MQRRTDAAATPGGGDGHRVAVLGRAAPAGRNRRQGLAPARTERGIGRSVATTAGFNVALLGALGIGGVILARTVGAAARGEYAAITAWFDVALVIGQCGQPAALCFFVAHDPLRAPQYVATSRTMMVVTSALLLAGSVLFIPLLADRSPAVSEGYWIALVAAIAALIGTSYVSPLQPRDIHRWNLVRISQPLLSLAAITGLWGLRLLTLHSALTVLTVTMLLQLACGYLCCRHSGLAPGRAEGRLRRPLTVYGFAQLAALGPATLNAQLGQLVLSQAVPAADLGRYAIAVSLTLLPMPLVSAIGNVVFPRLAALRVPTGMTRRLQLLAIAGSAGLAIGILLPLGAAAHWLIPAVFGSSYRGAVPLLWALIPGAIFAACGQVVGDLLRGANRVAAVARAQVPAAILLVFLIITLLPTIGVMGAAVASTLAYGIALTLLVRSLRRSMTGS